MGLKLGRLLKKVVKTGVPLLSGFLAGGPAGALMAGTSLLQAKAARTFAPVASGIPSIQDITGVTPFFAQPVVQRNGGLAVPAAGAAPMVVMGMTRAVAMAIARLATALGIVVTLQSAGRVGMRLWRTVTAFARRHPGLSVVSFLASLGLTIEEASEFLMWGQLKQKRRRGRGISARDIRIARRTIRRVAAFQRDLVGLHRHRGRARGREGVVVARAG